MSVICSCFPSIKLAVSQKVAAEATGTVFPFSGMLIAGIIAVSTLGTIGIYTLSAPRIYYAMADDGLFFKGIAKVHPKFQTPIYAIIIQSVWSVVLLLFWGTFAGPYNLHNDSGMDLLRSGSFRNIYLQEKNEECCKAIQNSRISLSLH